jgi:hypothetical protein
MNLVKHLANVHRKSIDGSDLEDSVKCKECGFTCVAGTFVYTYSKGRSIIKWNPGGQRTRKLYYVLVSESLVCAQMYVIA